MHISIKNIIVNSDMVTVAFTSETDAPYQWMGVDSVPFAATK